MFRRTSLSHPCKVNSFCHCSYYVTDNYRKRIKKFSCKWQVPPDLNSIVARLRNNVFGDLLLRKKFVNWSDSFHSFDHFLFLVYLFSTKFSNLLCVLN